MHRDALILTVTAIIAVAIGTFIFFSNGGNLASVFSAMANNDSSSGTVQFTEIASGSQSEIQKRVNYIITSTSQFSELWKMVKTTGTPPAVDFKTHAVLAIFAGTQLPPSAIAIANIEDSNMRRVSIKITANDGSCSGNQPYESPYEIVAVPTTSLSLTHEDIVATTGCSK